MRRSYGRDLGLSVRMAIAMTLIALIYIAGFAFFGGFAIDAARGGDWGAAAGGLMFAGMTVFALLVQLRKSEALILRAVGAKVLAPDAEPDLQQLAARVAAQADLPAPRVALIRSWAPNALSAARSPHSAVIAVTTELLRRLDRHELEAVVAHELAHVANRDGAVMTFVSGPAMLASWLWRDVRLSYVLVFWLTVPFHVVSLLLLWTMSRYREYVADRGAVLITGAPENLMSALLKIEGGAPPRKDLRGGLAAQAFCIVGRRSRWRRFELVMDHPPMHKRIARLEELARELGKPVV
jgi:heat shock protein HtpX